MDKNYILLHNHDFYSLLDSPAKPSQIADRCIKLNMPAIATTNHRNISGCIQFHKTIKKAGIKPILGCLLKNQTIYTKDGIKNVQDIVEGDYVLTHKGRYRRVSGIMKRNHTDKLYKICLSGNSKKSIIMTGEHPVLIRDINGNINWVRADKIVGGRKNKTLGHKYWKEHVCFPKNNINTISIIDVNRYLPNHLSCIDGFVQKTSKLNKYDSIGKIWSNIKEKIIIDEDFSYFLGLYVAEGSVDRNKDGSLSGQITLSFNINEIKFSDFCVKLLKDKFNIDATTHIREDKSIREVYACCLPLAYIISGMCGIGSYNKKIPNEIFESDISCRRSFVVGLLDGDGKKGIQNTLKVSSKILAWQFKRIVVDFGDWSNVSEYNYTDIPSYSVSYTLNKKYNKNLSDENYTYKPISHVEILKNDSVDVFNFEVEEDNSYVSDFCLHNCEIDIAKHDASIKDNSNRKTRHLVILAKNFKGWKQLIKIVTKTNHKDIYYYKPRIDLERLSQFLDGNIISFPGHVGSDLADILFGDRFSEAYNAKTIEDAGSCLDPDHYEKCKRLAEYHRDIFGKENFFLEIQNLNQNHMPAAKIIAEVLRDISKDTGIPCVATADAHYASPEYKQDQQILVANNLKVDFKTVIERVKNNEDVSLGGFFTDAIYHIPSLEEMKYNTDEELKNTYLIADMCEDYEVTAQPMLPKFPDTNGKSDIDYLKQMCRDGWKIKLSPEEKKNPVYIERIKMELDVVEKWGLAGYFLIVQDIVNWSKNQGALLGCARGCNHPNNPIVMDDGNVKKIKDVVKGDCVYTIDGSINKVLDVFEYDCDEELLEIKCWYGDSTNLTLTKDHEVFAEIPELHPNWDNLSELTKKSIKSRKDPVGSLKWIRADKLEVGGYVFIPKPIVQEHNIKLIDLSKYSDSKRLTHDENNVYHNKYNGLTKKINWVQSNNRYILCDDKFYRFLGMFVGNGWLNTHKDNIVGVAFNSEHTEKIDFIINYFEGMGYEVRRRDSKTSKLTQLEIISCHLRCFIKDILPNYNFCAESKYIPDIVIFAKEQYIKDFIKGYSETDGSNSGRSSFTTISSKLAYQTRFLFYRLRIPAGIRFDDRKDKRKGFENIKRSYVISVPKLEWLYGYDGNQQYRYFQLDNGILIRIREINKVKTSNKVYDLHVENNHNYLTSTCLIHNSAGGCMISHLTGITTALDPIKYKLIFERFFNEGRCQPGRVALPDIDLDFPTRFRKKVFEYTKEKYGADKFGHICTFGTMKGRAAIKDCLRINNACDQFIQNEITTYIPDEAAITDELEEMREIGETPSIIIWSLRNNAKKLAKWAHLTDSGEIEGDFAPYFKQAIRLEGCKRQISKHASAILLSDQPLGELVPMAYDTKNPDQPYCAFDMHSSEDVGMVKFDFLGVNDLDKTMMCLEEIEKYDMERS